MRAWGSEPVSGTGLQAGAVLKGVLATFVCSLALSAVLAVVVYTTSLREQDSSALLLVVGVGSLVLGAAYGAHLAHARGWAHGLATGLVYVLAALLLSPLLFPGGWSTSGAAWRLLLGMGAGALGGVLGVNL